MDFGLKLHGRVVLVTGGSRGIGRASALALAAGGADVAISYRVDQPAAVSTVRELEEYGVSARAFQADLSVPSDANQLVGRAEAELGPIQVLVANAGHGHGKTLETTTDEELGEVLGTNLAGGLRVTRAAIGSMRAAGWGRIVVLSSVTGRSGRAFLSVSPTYAASKAGLLGMVRAAAIEVAGDGITVNAIAPGWIETDATRHASDEHRRRARELIPIGRTGTPTDVAGVVAFLASDAAAYVTGACIDVNGGLYMA